MWKAVLIWIGCVALGAIGAFLIGALIWGLGFELLGGAVALAGAGIGGIMVLMWYMNWSEAM
jgi:hypothetical protein